MNEHIDILFAAANLATRNDPWAHLATQTMSMGYNVSMLWHYNYQLGMANAIPGYLPAEQIRTYRQERIKHTVLLSVVSVGLIIGSIATLVDSK